MDRKRNLLAQPKGRDLKRYFEVVGSSSNSSPSTHESGNAPGQSAHQNQVNSVEGENANFVSVEQVEEEITDSVEAIVEENVEVLGDEDTMDLEMERMMGCQIPAFGVWNYCSDLPITQYFDLAMQARLLKRHRHRRCCNHGDKHGGGERRLVLFNASPPPHKPPQIKVIRTEVGEKQGNGGEPTGGAAADDATKRVAAARAVDEDLYKVLRPLIYQKPRKMRKVVWSLWIGCLGLDCIA